jgi:amino acid transporter
MAFFAFIGFEEIANMAEEVRDLERILTRAAMRGDNC